MTPDQRETARDIARRIWMDPPSELEMMAERARVEAEIAAALSAEASANAMLREAIETYLDAEWGDIIDEPPAEMLAWLELHRPDCKSDIALARALAASPSSLTARVMAERRETIAEAIYKLDPFIESGEYVEQFQVSPGGALTWEQAKRRDAEFADDKIFLPITKFAYEAADAALAALIPSAAPGETERK